MATTKNLIKEILLAARPVGSYYASSEPTDPAKLFGGTWRRITNRVIYAASDQHPAGSTGGTETVALKANQNGPHSHGLTQIYQGFTMTYGGQSCIVPTDISHVGVRTTDDGDGAPHDNMMPYIAAYMWQRTA